MNDIDDTINQLKVALEHAKRSGDREYAQELEERIEELENDRIG